LQDGLLRTVIDPLTVEQAFDDRLGVLGKASDDLIASADQQLFSRSDAADDRLGDRFLGCIEREPEAGARNRKRIDRDIDLVCPRGRQGENARNKRQEHHGKRVVPI
jgi:hypothetical protein